MAYLLRPYEINYYAFSQWADAPARLLHRLLVENLDKSGVWSTVLQTPSAIPAQYRLGGVQAANQAAAKLITEMADWLEKVFNEVG
ncbi:MAG: putative ABC-type transport system, auxiliary component [Deltaproteobacteria bacterium]|nr:putative ABC-type transport system, auxiliary component [Deltaproteobacteria bacterium]